MIFRRVTYRAIFLIALASLSIESALSQGHIEWIRSEYSDMHLPASTEDLTIEYRFKNNGRSVIHFNDAILSSSFIEVSGWDLPVEPGGQGSIYLTFNPSESPIEFYEELKLIADNPSENSILKLRIRQCDNPDYPGLLYRYKIGRLRSKTARTDAGSILAGLVKRDTITLFNPTEEDIHAEALNLPAELTVRFEPERIPAGGFGEMIISFRASTNTKYGYYYKSFTIEQNGSHEDFPQYSYSCNLQENFSGLTEEDMALAPVITIDQPSKEFGTIKRGQEAHITFIIGNGGERDLIIHKISTSCGCTIAKATENIIPAGGSTEIEVTFDSRGRSGYQNKSIYILSNDPRSPELELTITGVIK